MFNMTQKRIFYLKTHKKMSFDNMKLIIDF